MSSICSVMMTLSRRMLIICCCCVRVNKKMLRMQSKASRINRVATADADNSSPVPLDKAAPGSSKSLDISDTHREILL